MKLEMMIKMISIAIEFLIEFGPLLVYGAMIITVMWIGHVYNPACG